jgi:hypothetical protein
MLAPFSLFGYQAEKIRMGFGKASSWSASLYFALRNHRLAIARLAFTICLISEGFHLRMIDSPTIMVNPRSGNCCGLNSCRNRQLMRPATHPGIAFNSITSPVPSCPSPLALPL